MREDLAPQVKWQLGSDGREACFGAGPGNGVDTSPCLSLIIPNRLPLEPGRKFPEEAEGKEAVFGEALDAKCFSHSTGRRGLARSLVNPPLALVLLQKAQQPHCMQAEEIGQQCSRPLSFQLRCIPAESQGARHPSAGQ